MKKLFLLFTFLISINVSHCAKVTDNLSFAYELKQAIVEHYNTDNIKVIVSNINENEFLKIEIEDSKFSNYSSEKKEKIAKHIGMLALELSKDQQKIITGELTFVDSANFLIVKTKSEDSYKLN